MKTYLFNFNSQAVGRESCIFLTSSNFYRTFNSQQSLLSKSLGTSQFWIIIVEIIIVSYKISETDSVGVKI